jgi:DNA-binding PadR family transcriptional regulator
MDVSVYLEVRDLFKFKWDPAVLDVLAECPYRYLALARRVRTLVAGTMEHGAVTRALVRLQEAGYVHATPTSAGARDISVYELTDKGHQALATYRAILSTFEQMRPPESNA